MNQNKSVGESIKIGIIILAVLGIVGAAMYGQFLEKRAEKIMADDYYVIKLYKNLAQPSSLNTIRTIIIIDNDWKISYDLYNEANKDDKSNHENNNRSLSNSEIKKIKSLIRDVESVNESRNFNGIMHPGQSSVGIMIDAEEQLTINFEETSPPNEPVRELMNYLYEIGKIKDG